METLKVIVSGGKDHYGAWVADIEGIYGVGETLDEVESDIRTAIDIFCDIRADIPEVLKNNPKLELVFDITGLVKYYSQFISFPGMEKITGINQKQLWQYANGYKTPRKDTALKIEKGLKEFATQLENEKIAV